MSRFSRSYAGALRASHITQTDVAAATGLASATISRLLSDTVQIQSEHVEKLLEVLPDMADRLFCLREFLLDQAPASYAARVNVTVGEIAAAKMTRRPDDLATAMRYLEDVATNDKALSRLLVDLAEVVTVDPVASKPVEKLTSDALKLKKALNQ